MTKRSIDTLLAHISEQHGERGSLNVPIYQNSTFAQNIPGTWEEYTYTRTNNPTEEALRKSIALLEGGTYAVMFSSGLAAINALLELFSPGTHIISTADIYGGTHRLFSQFGSKRGLIFSYTDTTILDNVVAACTTETKLIYIETPSNPLLSLSDISALSTFAHSKGILLAVDNTLATPYLQQPLHLGADLIVHSTSKYLSGHTNVIGGAVVANNRDLLNRMKFIHKATGGVPSPFDCYLTMLGLKTLGLRMQQHQKNAQYVAQFLSSHAKVKRVYYPGLVEHPQHHLAKKQMKGFGGIVSFELKGDELAAQRCINALELFSLTISFGSTTSLVNYPAKMSHKEMPREERIARGFHDTLIRLSLGIEDGNDLIEDLEQALNKV